MTDVRVIRLALDINVPVADLLSRRRNLRPGAATMIADAVRDGTCPAGPVQLVISLPMTEAYANVLERRLGYARTAAEEPAWLLAEYALAGPPRDPPYLPVGAGVIPFETVENSGNRSRHGSDRRKRPGCSTRCRTTATCWRPPSRGARTSW